MCACVDVARRGEEEEGREGCITQESRGAIRSRTFYSAVVGAGKSSHVSFTRIRNVSHKYTEPRAHPRADTRWARNFFRLPRIPRPRNANPPILPRSSPSLPRFPPLVRSNPKTAIPHLSLHLLDLQRLKRKLVRSHPDGTSVHFLFFIFFPLFFSPFCSPHRLCLPRHRAR